MPSERQGQIPVQPVTDSCLQRNTELRAPLGGMKPPLIPIQFVEPGVVESIWGIDILQAAPAVCCNRWCFLAHIRSVESEASVGGFIIQLGTGKPRSPRGHHVFPH